MLSAFTPISNSNNPRYFNNTLYLYIISYKELQQSAQFKKKNNKI